MFVRDVLRSEKWEKWLSKRAPPISSSNNFTLFINLFQVMPTLLLPQSQLI